MIPAHMRHPAWMVSAQIRSLQNLRRTRVLNPWAPPTFKSKPTWRALKIKYRKRLIVSRPDRASPIKYRPGKTQRDLPAAEAQRAWDALHARDRAKIERAELARRRREIEGSWA